MKRHAELRRARVINVAVAMGNAALYTHSPPESMLGTVFAIVAVSISVFAAGWVWRELRLRQQEDRARVIEILSSAD